MTNTAVEILGTIGGSLIALSLLPQVIHTFKIKSAGDISYIYQSVYITGTTFVNVYAIAFGLWPVYIPCLLEETFIVTLTIQKVLYDHNDRKKKRKEKSNRELFSNTIAKSMRRLSEGDSQLNIMNMTPEKVMEEFKKIDSSIEADGTISKEELKAYIDTGKMGEIKDKDFEKMWRTMDTDGSGDVSFVEFCSYIGSCHDVMEGVEKSAFDDKADDRV